MEELNGNEKYSQLPKALPTNESRPGTIRAWHRVCTEHARSRTEP